VIAIPAMTPVRDQKVKTPAMKEPAMVEPKPRRVVATKRRAPKIPATEFARIRTLAEYGMTIAQLAEIYGVSVGEIQRIVGTAVDSVGSATLAAD
jgi:DNA-binding transcriptional regulator YiaG